MAVVSISLPDDLLERADAHIAQSGFDGRSELFRAALRDHLDRETSGRATGERSATLTLVYPEGQERRFGRVRHDHTDVVRSMMHGHTHGSGHDCVEVFMLEGPDRRIREFADALRADRTTRVVRLTWTDVAE